jgi:hypothetical protein
MPHLRTIGILLPSAVCVFANARLPRMTRPTPQPPWCRCLPAPPAFVPTSHLPSRACCRRARHHSSMPTPTPTPPTAHCLSQETHASSKEEAAEAFAKLMPAAKKRKVDSKADGKGETKGDTKGTAAAETQQQRQQRAAAVSRLAAGEGTDGGSPLASPRARSSSPKPRSPKKTAAAGAEGGDGAAAAAGAATKQQEPAKKASKPLAAGAAGKVGGLARPRLACRAPVAAASLRSCAYARSSPARSTACTVASQTSATLSVHPSSHHTKS